MFPLKNLARKGLTMMHDFATVGSNRSDLIKQWHSPNYPIMWSRLNHFCMVNSLVPKGCGSTFTRVCFKLILWLTSWSFPVKLVLGECHRTLLMKSQHWPRYWLGAISQQAITWSNVDPDLLCHMVSLGYNGLRIKIHDDAISNITHCYVKKKHSHDYCRLIHIILKTKKSHIEYPPPHIYEPGGYNMNALAV